MHINLTSLYSCMLELCVSLLLVTVILGAPEQTLLKEIQQHSCVFPLNLKFLPKCSNFTLSSNISDLHKQENVEFYLCIALLDSTNRLCPLVTKNKDFGIRVEKALNESKPTIISSDDNRFCNEMTLDPNTTLDQAKYIYNKLRPPHCVSICIGLDENDAVLRAPVCKSIQFAHQQIKVARDLQQQLNKQESKPETDQSEIHHRVISENSNPPRENQPPTHVLSTQNSNLQESHSSQNRGAAPSIISDGQSQANNPSNLETQEGQERSKLGTAPQGKSDAQGEKGSEKTVKDDGNAGQVAAPLAGANGAEAVPKLMANNPADVEQLTDDEPPMDPPDLQESPDDTNGEQEENVGNGNDAGDPNGGEPRGQLMDELSEVDNKYSESQKNAGKDAGSPNVMDKLSNSDAPHSYTKSVAVIVPPFVEAEDSHFFTYFLSSSAFFILGYLVYHNKRKIIAMAVEGKKGRNTGRRRPNSASYHKLDSNLEEAMSSNLSSTNSYVIY